MKCMNMIQFYASNITKDELGGGVRKRDIWRRIREREMRQLEGGIDGEVEVGRKTQSDHCLEEGSDEQEATGSPLTFEEMV